MTTTASPTTRSAAAKVAEDVTLDELASLIAQTDAFTILARDPMTPIESVRDLPSDGCITIRPWDRTRRRGWHVERVEAEHDGSAWVTASPMSATSGAITGAPRRLHLRFGLDVIEPMP